MAVERVFTKENFLNQLGSFLAFQEDILYSGDNQTWFISEQLRDELINKALKAGATLEELLELRLEHMEIARRQSFFEASVDQLDSDTAVRLRDNFGLKG